MSATVCKRDALSTAAIDEASVRHLPAWARERFPARTVLFAVVLYATMLVVARAGAAGAPIALRPTDLGGALALTALLLVLRVLDEHKDFAEDAIAHPRRVLQRGLVTLGMLRAVGAAAMLVALTVTLAAAAERPAPERWTLLLWFGGTAAWAALMTREFFARRWLRAHPVVYAFSHLLVMSIATGWLMTIASPDARIASVAAMMALTFLASLAVEIARKVRAPADEHANADSYTRALGIRRAAIAAVAAAWAAIATSVVVLGMATGETVRLAAGVYAPAAVAALIVLVAALRFAARPTRRRAKAVEASAGAAMLLVHLMIIGAALAVHGVAP